MNYIVTNSENNINTASQQIEIIIEKLITFHETTDTLVYIYGKSNLGKTKFGLLLSKFFGPYEQINEYGLVNDTLVYDDACINKSSCFFIDECGSVVEPRDICRFTCNIKFILCGIGFKCRRAKVGNKSASERTIRIDTIVTTSNLNRSYAPILTDHAIQRRAFYIHFIQRLPHYDIEEEIQLLRINFATYLSARKKKLEQCIADCFV
jgi:hypothetical protein